MPERFGKRKPQPEISPGGSVIHRYPINEWSMGRVGLSDGPGSEFAAARNEVYGRLFGQIHDASMEAISLVPRVDVHTYYRQGANGDNVCALVTAGMSDIAMHTPAGAEARRVELIFYCSTPIAEYVETLRWLAHFPHDQKTWVGSGHTIPNGSPPAPFWGSSVLDTILLLPPLVKRDRTLPDELTLGGDPVHFLWVVPLTTAECNLKLEQGANAILNLFQQHRHPHVFDPHRASYV
jgi:Suppressor of fused protein (SUFU)